VGPGGEPSDKFNTYEGLLGLMSAPKLTVPPIGQLLLVAILLTFIAALSTFESSYTTAITAALVISAVIAGLVEFTSVWTGNPGTPIPWKTLAIYLVTAVVYICLWAIHQTVWDTYTAIGGALLALTYLEQEVAQGTSNPTPTPTPSSSPGPP